jgi:hypothetical protein
MIDFVNLKFKTVQYFRCDHKDMVYVYIFIRISAHTCMSICVCNMFLKK